MKKLKTALQSRFLFKIITSITVIIRLLMTNLYTYQSKYSKTTTKFKGKVTSYKIEGDKLTIVLSAKEKLITNYYFKEEKEKKYYEKNLKLGDKLKIIGVLQEPNNNTLPNEFNYKKYLYNNHIYYILTAKTIKKIKNNTSISYDIKNKIKERLSKIDNTGYLRTFILGDKTYLEKDIIQTYQQNGISHLFAVSGMHVSLLTGILLFILGKITYNNKYKYSIITIFLVFYLFLTDYSASILRTVILFILNGINKTFNLKIKPLDIMLLVISIICLINPFILYNTGFQFSYIISFTLIVLSKNIKRKLIKNIYSSYLCFLVSIPICIYNFYQINAFSIFLNLLMIPLVSVIVFPLSIMTCIMPKLVLIYNKVIYTLEITNKIASNIKILCITFPKPSLIFILILYIVIYLTIKNKKNLIVIIIILSLYKYYPYINNSLDITFIDVGQGDSALVIFPQKKSSILIDTGGKITTSKEKWQQKKEEFSYIKDKTIPYLKSLDIKKLDYLILTHGDYDHMGEAITLVNNFKVEKVIFNCGLYNDLEKELIKVLDKKKIKYYLCIKELNIDKNKLYFLQTKEYDNENDNSNVIYTELYGYKFMFMGDASSTTEKEILSKYNLPDLDVLKVGHHGSKTSSGKKFIDEINPKYSIISVGKKNRYGHPNKEVLDNLKDSKIYRTDEDGSIMLKIKNNKLKIETCSP